MECDIFAGEHGPSCRTLEHIIDLNKGIHVRFVSCNDVLTVLDNDSSEEAPFKKAKIEKRAGTSFQFP